MNLGIKGKRALVTGGTRGIGHYIAQGLVSEGVDVVVVARNKATTDLSLLQVDLMEPGGPANMAHYLEQYHPVDIVVHCVGGTLDVRDALSPVDDWERVWKYNVGIGIEINNVLVPQMQKRGWGRIVHVSSDAADNLRGCAAYGPAKRALEGYVKVLGRQVAPDGVVVSAIKPGAYYAEGGHWDDTDPEKMSDFLRHHQAQGRIGTAEEVAPLAVFMCSQQAAFCAGSLMQIDGGTM